MKSQRGQAMLQALVLFPLILIIFAAISRNAQLFLVHSRLENHCHRKILDALETQGHALQFLGGLNPIAREVVLTRRAIAPLLFLAPELLPIYKALIKVQGVIYKAQVTSLHTSEVQTASILASPSEGAQRYNAHEYFTPKTPKLYVERETEFDGEKGGPLQLQKAFSRRQNISGREVVSLKEVLPHFKILPDPPQTLTITCKAQLYLERLEDKWSAQVVDVAKR